MRTERSVWAWVALGLAGSLAVALAGPPLAGGPVRWWYTGGGGAALLYAGIVALGVAWLALGRLALTARMVWIVAALWCVPLVLTAPLFSQDAYSYLAQGTLVHLGLNPYRDAPAVLAQHGQAHVLDAVAPFWRHTTAPYGPLFLWIVSAFAGSSLVVGVLLIRAIELIGFVLLAVFVPRLARALGADGGRAAWWVLLSPLVLLQLVAAAHNDLLMIGLLAAGVTLAVEGRTLPAVAVCALAATIKLPAAAAIPFILVATGDRKAWAPGVLVALVVIVAVSLASGLGLGWISTSVFSTPAKVRLAITPATALGWTAAQVLPVGARGSRVGPRRSRHVRGRARGYRAAVARTARDTGSSPGHPAPGGRPRWAGSLALVSELGPGLAGGDFGAAGLARTGARGGGLPARRQSRRDPGLPAAYRAAVPRAVSRRGRRAVDLPATSGDGRRAPAITGAGRILMATQSVLEPVRAPEAAGLPTAQSRWSEVAVVAGPAALAIALCLFELTTRSLWLDEAATVAIAGQHGSALWNAIAHDGGNMLGYYAVMHVLLGWFGHGAFVLRLPSALAAGGAAAAVSVLALRLFDRRVAVTAGLLTAVSLPLVFWGQDGRGYALMVALVAGSFAAFAALVQDDSDSRPRTAWIAYVVLTALSVYASFVAVLAVPAQLTLLVSRRHAWRRVAAALLACVVSWVPLAVLAATRGSGQLFWIPRPSLTTEKQVILALTSAGFEPNFHPTVVATGLAILTVALLLAACLLAARARQWGAQLAAAWLLVPLILMWAESLIGQPIFTARNLLVSLPAVALLLGWLLARTRAGWAVLVVAAGRARGGGGAELRHVPGELACRHRLHHGGAAARRLPGLLSTGRADALCLLHRPAGQALHRALRGAPVCPPAAVACGWWPATRACRPARPRRARTSRATPRSARRWRVSTGTRSPGPSGTRA